MKVRLMCVNCSESFPVIVYIQTKVHFEDGYGTVSGYFRRCCGEGAVTYFPLAGVTTNPSIIAAGKKPLEVVLPELHEAMGGQGRLFAR